MKSRRFFLLSILIAGATALAFASPSASSWDDDEDDIYYNESKSKNKTQNNKKGQNSNYYTPATVASDYPDPSTYTPAAGSGLMWMLTHIIAVDSSSCPTPYRSTRLKCSKRICRTATHTDIHAVWNVSTTVM